MLAAEMYGIGENHVAALEHGEGRDTATHINDGAAKVHFIFHERGKTCRIRRNTERGDIEVRTFDTGGNVAQCSLITGHEVNINAHRVAEHAARVADAVMAIDAGINGDCMD